MPDSLFDTRLANPLPVRSGSFVDQVRHFRAFGQPCIERNDANIPYLINEFWTSGQRQAHSLHEISYRACFKPQLPAFFIERLTQPGDAVHDPFMGRGTTPVQAALMGRRPVGNDINPLSILLTRPRLNPPALRDVAHRLRPDRLGCAARSTTTICSRSTARKRCGTSARCVPGCCDVRRPDGAPDPVDDWIRMVAINRLTGHSPGFFSVYTLPPNQAVSARSQRKINERRAQTPPDRDVTKLILRKSASLLSDGRDAAASRLRC